jgi:hypothetical protein
MNLFRSEEHILNWQGFVQGSEEGIVALGDLVQMFSGPYFRERLGGQWVSHAREYAREMGITMKKLGVDGPFWQPKKPQ